MEAQIWDKKALEESLNVDFSFQGSKLVWSTVMWYQNEHGMANIPFSSFRVSLDTTSSNTNFIVVVVLEIEFNQILLLSPKYICCSCISTFPSLHRVLLPPLDIYDSILKVTTGCISDTPTLKNIIMI